jgi:hypothetical protein
VLSPLLCQVIIQPTLRFGLLSIFQLTIRRSTLPADIPTYYQIFQPTIRRCAVFVGTLNDYRIYRLSALLSLELLQSTIRRSTLSAGTPTDYRIYRLSARLSLELLQPTMLCDLLYYV